jgi:hypothetical protein
MTSLRVLDLEEDEVRSYPVTDLIRHARPFSVMPASVAEARELMRRRDPKELLLITAPHPSDFAALGSLDGLPHVMGTTHDTGVWVAIGVPPAILRPLWPTARNRPFAGLLPARRRPVTGLTQA